MQGMGGGAGVVGLAIAREAALKGHDVIVAEAAPAIGTGTSSRNSEGIHAGLYYPSGSQRALHCWRSRRMLYAYCESHGIARRKLGKLFIVTKESDIPKLEAIYAQALANGVENVTMLDAGAAVRMEPALSCVAAFHSAETGIIDSHRYMLALQGDIEDRGGVLAFNTPVERLARAGAGWRAGFGGARPRFPPLLYPAPVAGGLGIRVTLDLAGRMRFGPDVEWIDTMNFDVDPRRGDAFYASIRSYWPGLPDNSLFADYAGVRPKLTGPGEPAADFVVDGPAEHGLPRLVPLFGIGAPGL